MVRVRPAAGFSDSFFRHHFLNSPFPQTTYHHLHAMALYTLILLIIASFNLLKSSSALVSTSTTTIKMVEGHSVHRIASRFRSSLIGKKFSATSPNGRFVEGARAIDGKVLSRMEAVGKNLFAFFSSHDSNSSGSKEHEIDGDDGLVCYYY